MRLRAALACAALAPATLPEAALAHAGERMVILTLPTGHYIAGAAAAVALTGLAGVVAPRLPRAAPRLLFERPAILPDGLGSWIACFVLAALVAIGFLGSRDPLRNLLPLTVWTLVWVGLTLATLLFGDLWRAIDPWRAPVRAARRALGRAGSAGLARLGHWPAVVGFLAFAWFEIVSPAPDDPAVLARAVAAYWLVIFGLAVLEGDALLAQGEAFGVYFAFIARIAPLWREIRSGRVREMAGLPGAQILAMPPLGPSAAAFVTLVLASVSFDGLARTFRWLAFVGVNPLEFPGRSAMLGVNTAGLICAWGLTSAAILGTIALGRRLAGARGRFWDAAGPCLLSFLPIAAAFHAAHYLVALLTNGQHAIVALSDPLALGWNLLRLPEHWVSFAFMSDRAAVQAIWQAQFALIVGAHVLAVLLSLSLSARAGPSGTLAHAPMTALMVAYTVFGLWLLSSPTA